MGWWHEMAAKAKKLRVGDNVGYDQMVSAILSVFPVGKMLSIYYNFGNIWFWVN